MKIVSQHGRYKQRDKNGDKKLSYAGAGRAKGQAGRLEIHLHTTFSLAAFDVNKPLNCEAGPACEEGRRSELKELPRQKPSIVYHDLGWCEHHKTSDAPFIFDPLIYFQGLIKDMLQVWTHNLTGRFPQNFRVNYNQINYSQWILTAHWQVFIFTKAFLLWA